MTSFLLFILLCASLAYWGLQLFKPPLRPVAAPPTTAQAEVRPQAAAVLFGGRAGNAEVASNYQLQGVIFSGNPRDSVAILQVEGKPVQAIRVGREVVPGVMVEEVHRDYVLLSENGVSKRVELPENATESVGLGGVSPVPVQQSVAPPPVPPPA
ncbi:MAG TPA: type II secretion system protein N, partial [Noviherbaspirillum sp.]|nr:type II secretion system protein N [Noviherbaspirillum sp.]